MIAEALIKLADVANCVNGDFHLMHLNYRGAEFDALHKEVLQKYYDEAAEDYDTWAEAALMFTDTVPSPNESAVRLEWQSLQGPYTRESAVQRIDELLSTYCAALLIVFDALDSNEKCFASVGVANTLQTRIEYWSKEKEYFNKRRTA